MKKKIICLLLMVGLIVMPEVKGSEESLMSVFLENGFSAPIESYSTDKDLFDRYETAKGISYTGSGNIVEFNNTSNPMIASTRSDVIINITNDNKINTLVSLDYNQKYTITGTGTLEIGAAKLLIENEQGEREETDYTGQDLLEYATSHINTDLEMSLNDDEHLIIKGKEPVLQLDNNSVSLIAEEDLSNYNLKIIICTVDINGV